MLIRRYGVLNAHDELNMRLIVHQPFLDQPGVRRDMRQIEDLDLRPDAVLLHACRSSLTKTVGFSYTIVGKLTDPVESEAISGLG